jgi:hypothetical protein
VLWPFRPRQVSSRHRDALGGATCWQEALVRPLMAARGHPALLLHSSVLTAGLARATAPLSLPSRPRTG